MEANSESQVPTLSLEAIGDPVYVLDADKTIRAVNQALLEFTEYERADIVGRNLRELVPGEAERTLTEQLDTLAQSDRPRATFETQLLDSEGELVLAEVTFTAQSEMKGSSERFVGVLRDIRARKRRERDFDLFKQVLTRVFRHNIRNELTVVDGFAEALRDQVDEQAYHYVERIREATDRLHNHSEKARLVERVVETTERRDSDVTTIVKQAVDSLCGEHAGFDATLDLPAEAMVRAHPDIHHAIEEVLTNAVEHTPDDTTPEIDVWLDDRPGETILFVEDNAGGLGEHETRILRSKEETALQHTSGVGLWLVRWLVEYSGAELFVHRTGEGTVIGIKFQPADVEAATERYSPDDSLFVPAPTDVRDVEPEQFRGETVLERAEILDELEEIYHSLSSTGGHSVVVTGEAGIGKTTLVEQFRSRVTRREDAPVVATGFCEQDSQSPYSPFRSVLDELPGEQSFEEIRSVADDFNSSDPDEAQQRRQMLFADVADQFRAAVTDQPVVVVIEDMHWADSGTIGLFEFLVDELGRWSHPILFVCTYRTSNVEESHPVIDIAADAEETGRGTRIRLDPLRTADVETLLALQFGVEELPDAFAKSIRDQTGGNPLFVSELGKHLRSEFGQVDSGDELPTTIEDVAVPKTIQQAIDQRLSELPAAVMPALEAGAVLGESFSFDVLREASDRSVDRVIESVNRLVGREIWTRSEGRLEFVHGVIREEVRDGIEPDRERTLHERATAAIEAVHSGNLDAYANRLAHHYREVDAHDTAFSYYRQAGDVAGGSYANDEAIAAYESATVLATEHDVATDRTVAEVYADLAGIYNRIDDGESAERAVEAGLAAAPGDSDARCRLLGQRARALRTRSEYGEAADVLERQRELAASLGIRSLEATALDRRGTVAMRLGDYEQAIEYHERSLDIFDDVADLQRQASPLRNLGVIAFYRGAYEQASTYFERSLAISEEVGDRREQAKSLNNLGAVYQQRGDYEQARRYYERSLSLKEEIGDRRGQADSLRNLGIISMFGGAYEQARKYSERGLAISEDIGDRKGQASSLSNLGSVAENRGEYERATEYYERCRAISREIGDHRTRILSLQKIGNAALIRGTYDRAEEYYRQGLDIAEENGERPWQAELLITLSDLHRQKRDTQNARAALDRAGEILSEVDRVEGDIQYYINRAALARAAQEPDQAETHLENALTACDDIDQPRLESRVSLERTRLALARRDTEQARNTLETVHSVLADLDTPLEAARASRLEGRLAAETGEHDEAREHLEEALAVFEDIGARLDTLRTLEHLIDLAREGGDTDQARQWCRQAGDRLDDAPEALADVHREWVEHQARTLGVAEAGDSPS